MFSASLMGVHIPFYIFDRCQYTTPRPNPSPMNPPIPAVLEDKPNAYFKGVVDYFSLKPRPLAVRP